MDPSEIALDLEDPRSILNLVPNSMKEAYIKAYAARPELFCLDERSLYLKLRSERRGPNATDNRLRLALWLEYDRAQGGLSKIQHSYIYGGICSLSFFNTFYLVVPERVAWLFTRPASYVVVTEEALQFGIEQLREILEMPNMMEVGHGKKKKEVLNVRLIELKAKIVGMLDIRVKGAPLQRVHQITENRGLKQIENLSRENSMEEIQHRIKLLERQNNAPVPEIVQPASVELVMKDG